MAGVLQSAAVRIQRRHLDERRAERPPEYSAQLLAVGRWEGDELVVSDDAFAAWRERWTPPEPTLLELAANFSVAIGRWAGNGFPVADAKTIERRLGPDGCGGCTLFDREARGGRGACRHSSCGCTTVWKVWLATERCPLGRWPT